MVSGDAQKGRFAKFERIKHAELKAEKIVGLDHVNPSDVFVHRGQDNVTVLVQVVIGKFDLLEGDVVFGPLSACRRRVRVDKVPTGHLRFGLSSDGPLLARVLVPRVVGEAQVEQDVVVVLRVESGHGDSEGGKHSPVKKELVKFWAFFSFALAVAQCLNIGKITI